MSRAVTIGDAVNEAVDHAVAVAPPGDRLLARVRLQEQSSRRRPWLAVVGAVAAATAVATGAAFVAGGAQTAAPPPAERAGDTRAVAEEAGVRVVLELPDATVRGGELLRATASVTNLRDTAVTFGGGSCQDPDKQPNVDVDLRPGQPAGRAWAGTAEAFKTRALTGTPYRHALTAQEGQNGCLTYLKSWRLEPQQTLTVTDVVWRVTTPYDTAYGGTATVSATFQFTGTPDQAAPQVVTAQLPLDITVEGNGTLTPAAAIDKALSDPEFAAFVEANPPSTWATTGQIAGVGADPFYKDPTTGKIVTGDVWRVFLHRNEHARYGSIVLDPATGRVLIRNLPPPAEPTATAAAVATTAPASPAPSAPRPAATQSDLRTCGAAPKTTDGSVSLALDFPDVVTGSGAEGVATLTNGGESPIQVQDRQFAAANATREGQIVSAAAGTGDAPALVTLQPGESRRYRVSFPASRCGFDERLPAGSYLVAAEVLLQGGSEVVSNYVQVRFQP